MLTPPPSPLQSAIERADQILQLSTYKMRQLEIVRLIQERDELVCDKERLDAIHNNGWSVSFNTRIQNWIVQGLTQTVGNIGKGGTAREAIDDALNSTKP